MRVLLLAGALIGCQEAREPQSEAAIANQAQSLERAANATVDQQIAEIEAEANEAAAEGVVVPLDVANNASGE